MSVGDQSFDRASAQAGAGPEAGRILVIGAGINGLAAAAYLARAGRRVLVLEARDRIGGMAASTALEEGPVISECAHLVSALHPDVMSELGLYRHGLRFSHRRIPTVLARPGETLVLSEDPWDAEAAIARHAPDDAIAYRRFIELIRRLHEALDPLLTNPPARLKASEASLNETAHLIAARLGRLDGRDFTELAGMLDAPIAEVLDRHFASPFLKGGLAFDAVLGTFAAPSWGGTFLNFLHRRFSSVSGRWGAHGHPVGGLGALAEAFSRAAASQGAELRLDARVDRILVDGDRAVGVRLANGEEIAADLVVSALDPHTTFLKLVGAHLLDIGFADEIGRLGARGSVARLTFLLDGYPHLGTSGSDEPPVGRFIVAPDMAYLEAAFAPAKYGEAPEEPAVELTIPSVHDASMEHEGRHVVTALAIHAPYRPHETAETRQAFAEAVQQVITRVMPDFRRRVRRAEVLMPSDIEARYGARGGHWHHIDLVPDQLWCLRPHARAAAYRAPLEGLYLAGAGNHPWGGVSGLPGRGAALAILEDRGWG